MQERHQVQKKVIVKLETDAGHSKRPHNRKERQILPEGLKAKTLALNFSIKIHTNEGANTFITVIGEVSQNKNMK